MPRQLAQFVDRVPHLFVRAFEYSAATATENSIATKQYGFFGTVECDVIERVARYTQHREAEIVYRNSVTLVDSFFDVRVRAICWADYSGIVGCSKVVGSPSVIRVVMCYQYRSECKVGFLQVLFYNVRIAWIHDNHGARVGFDQPDIIVVKRGYR